MNDTEKKVDILKSLFQNIRDEKYVFSEIEPIFNMDKNNNPIETNGEILYLACELAKKLSPEVEHKLINKRFSNTLENYKQFIEPNMALIEPQPFWMGTDENEDIIYCGESPRHQVELSPYYIGKITITEEIYMKYNPNYQSKNEFKMPVTEVTWYDAMMFCKWAGCKLTSEAEWECAAKAGKESVWFCEEKKIKEYGWYCENSDGKLHQVAKLKPNDWGIYDLYGNVWEWCQDTYEENYYSNCPKHNPINKKQLEKKVCRGGSYHAFSEMCRNSFRDYASANFFAKDIGFRVTKHL